MTMVMAAHRMIDIWKHSFCMQFASCIVLQNRQMIACNSSLFALGLVNNADFVSVTGNLLPQEH